MTVRLRSNRVFDGESIHENGSYIIEYNNNEIVKFGRAEDFSEDFPGTLLDFLDQDVTILPGLIDCHVHLALKPTGQYQIDAMLMSDGQKTLLAYRNLRNLLRYGFTTIRSTGDPGKDSFPTFDCRWVEKFLPELGPLPRIFGAGHYISVTAGGGDFQLPPHIHNCHKLCDGVITDGPDEMLKVTRREIKHGSDWIKVLVSGAYMTSDGSPLHTHISNKEFKSVVDEANRRGIYVMAHAHSASSILQAVHLGARSIEHASFIDQEAVDYIIDNNLPVWIVPTVFISQYFSEHTQNDQLKKMLELQKTTNELSHACQRRAIESGIRVAFGTDNVGWEAKENWREAYYMVEFLGMSELDVLRSMTSSAADLLQQPIGRIQTGKKADLVIVHGNPVENISALSRPMMVIKDGKIIPEYDSQI